MSVGRGGQSNTRPAQLYGDGYFAKRDLNDPKRLKSFDHEKRLLEQHTDFGGAVCDVGCSTGEFLEYIGWRGPRYGMEINENAQATARGRGVSFDKTILTEEGFFNAVIFRGTIQHLPQPFVYIERAFAALARGGIVAFLATPNSNSLVYKLCTDLPALDPRYNYYIPSDLTLTAILRNAGFHVAALDYPYADSPYARPLYDHLQLLLCWLFRRKPRFAFWRSMMNVIAVKP
jgi:SAM-dependent methyltransferase